MSDLKLFFDGVEGALSEKSLCIVTTGLVRGIGFGGKASKASEIFCTVIYADMKELDTPDFSILPNGKVRKRRRKKVGQRA